MCSVVLQDSCRSAEKMTVFRTVLMGVLLDERFELDLRGVVDG